MLRIKRTQRDGSVTTELVTEPTIWSAYITQRKILEEENLDPDQLKPGEDQASNERMKKRSGFLQLSTSSPLIPCADCKSLLLI